MPGIASVSSGALLVALGLQVQAQPGFEVASIRRNLTGLQRGGGLAAPQPGGRFVALGATLKRLVGDAYDGLQVLGGPTWIDIDRFDVNARADRDLPPAEIRRMLPDSAGAAELAPDGLSLFTALQEQLGLRLQSARGPVEVIVVDRADPPSPD